MYKGEHSRPLKTRDANGGRMRKLLLLLLPLLLTKPFEAQLNQEINPACPELRYYAYRAHGLPKLRTIDIPGFAVELLNLSKAAIVVRRDRVSSSFQIERFSSSDQSWAPVVRIDERGGTAQKESTRPPSGDEEILSSFVLLKPGDTYSQRIRLSEHLNREQARSLGPGRYKISFSYSDEGHTSAPAGRIECTLTTTREFVLHH
jgi:hypothetical protein